jgi:alpha-tubulin suppressor-like RCC1 family protein
MWALDSSGKVWSWSYTQSTVDGKKVFLARALLVSDGGAQLDGVSAIATGGVYDGPAAACFVKAGGVLCLGSGALLGYGFTGDQWSFPVAVKVDASTPLSGVDRVSIGGDQACALKQDGTLWCWNKSSLFAQQSTLFANTKIKDLAVNNGFACVLLTDGSVRCWGSGASGELGDGQNTKSTAPVLVVADQAPLQDVARLSRSTRSVYGGGSTCALKTDSSLWCWGDGRSKAVIQTTTDGKPISSVFWLGSTPNAILPDGSVFLSISTTGAILPATQTTCP